jgi:hypothetical protein
VSGDGLPSKIWQRYLTTKRSPLCSRKSHN